MANNLPALEYFCRVVLPAARQFVKAFPLTEEDKQSYEDAFKEEEPARLAKKEKE